MPIDSELVSCLGGDSSQRGKVPESNQYVSVNLQSSELEPILHHSQAQYYLYPVQPTPVCINQPRLRPCTPFSLCVQYFTCQTIAVNHTHERITNRRARLDWRQSGWAEIAQNTVACAQSKAYSLYYRPTYDSVLFCLLPRDRLLSPSRLCSRGRLFHPWLYRHRRQGVIETTLE